MSMRVLVAGATGGVGQLTVAQLLHHNYTVRVLARNCEKAQRLFEDRVEIVLGNICQPETLPAATAGVDAILCCTGTTAFPSEQWAFTPPENPLESLAFWARVYLDADYRQQQAQNTPIDVDAMGVANLVKAAKTTSNTLKRFVFVSSCGINRKDTLPFNLLNAFGVLDAKAQGEAAIRASGLPYTIIRPARLIDGPYTSYDLNTLLKASTGGKQGIVLGTGDTLNGQTSRIDVAAACVACLSAPETQNITFEMISPRTAAIDWESLFGQL